MIWLAYSMPLKITACGDEMVSKAAGPGSIQDRVNAVVMLRCLQEEGILGMSFLIFVQEKIRVRRAN